MWMYIKLAWRNIFRNKRRTFIAGTAIGIGLASLIFMDALMIGMEDNLVKSATSTFLGEGQIHCQGFRQTHEVEQIINNLDQVITELNQEDIVEHFTLRTISFGMISSPANFSSVSMVGIHPPTEKHLSQIDDAITEGTYFESDNLRNIVIGSKLADILEVSIGDRVVMTVAQAYTGDLSQEMFRISGIYHFNVSDMDRGMAFIRLEKAQSMLGINQQVHEIAIKFTNAEYGWDKQLPFWNKYSNNGNEAVSWTVILPQLESTFAISKFSIFILGLILFAIVALGIINTIFMSLRERMFEFGVLRALGTRPFVLARMILFEAGALAIVSIGLGMVLGFLVTYITIKTGIDYTGIEIVGATMRELLYPVLQVSQFIFYPFCVFILTILVGLYPALHTARMSPASAMRKSL